MPSEVRLMFKVEINDAFKGNFNSWMEAMEEVEKWARPHRLSWVVYDPHGRIWARS
ncbi:hypothetical protein LBMAG42_54630 [Deltaproteobacteria bacterium]|nr:hypothetical protein LBMAG42_54630 [Deltaproteobacteria bacterium]